MVSYEAYDGPVVFRDPERPGTYVEFIDLNGDRDVFCYWVIGGRYCVGGLSWLSFSAYSLALSSLSCFSTRGTSCEVQYSQEISAANYYDDVRTENRGLVDQSLGFHEKQVRSECG